MDSIKSVEDVIESARKMNADNLKSGHRAALCQAQATLEIAKAINNLAEKFDSIIRVEVRKHSSY